MEHQTYCQKINCQTLGNSSQKRDWLPADTETQHSSQLWEMTGPINNSQEIFSGKPLLMFKSIFAAAGNQPHKVQRDPRPAVGTTHMARACLALFSPSELIGYASKRFLVTDKTNVINLCMSSVTSKQGQRATGSGWGVQQSSDNAL